MPPLVGVNTPEMQVDLEARLQDALTEQFAPMTVERVAMAGDPALQIVALAATRNVDLIMMPTHGFGLFRGLLIGSVTAKVLHDGSGFAKTEAEIRRDGKRVCGAELTFRLVEFPSPEFRVSMEKFASEIAFPKEAMNA